MKRLVHACICSDCKKEFFIEDAKWCKHLDKLGIGSKKCPHCGSCICHGETVEEIQARFDNNIKIGKFVKADRSIPTTDWKWQCKTIIEKIVED